MRKQYIYKAIKCSSIYFYYCIGNLSINLICVAIFSKNKPRNVKQSEWYGGLHSFVLLVFNSEDIIIITKLFYNTWGV